MGLILITLTLSQDNAVITMHIKVHGILKNISTELIGAVDVYGELLEIFETNRQRGGYITINDNKYNLNHDECCHLYESLDPLMDNLYSLAIAHD